MDDFSEMKPQKRSDASMSGVFADLKQKYQRAQRRSGGFGALWAEMVPTALAQASAIQRYDRGVLTIAVRDASSKFELDRLLRTGLEQDLRQRAPSTLKRVRLVLGGEHVTPRE